MKTQLNCLKGCYRLMFKKFQIFFLSVFCLFLSTSLGCDPSNPLDVDAASQAEKIESLIQNTLPNANIGIILRDAKTGKVLYERQARELFTPASVTKLFTAAASLLSLGPNYHFVTAVKIHEKDFQKEKLTGDLYIQFSGDPSLTTENLKGLISQVKESGIQQISGNIIIDNTCFQTPHYAQGWSWDALSWYYAAPVSSVILNENQIPIRLTSNNTLGEKAEIVCESEKCKWINLNSDVISVSEEEAETGCQIQAKMDQENALTLKGCWPYEPKPIILKVALNNPEALAEKLILEALNAENIQFKGKIVVGAAPQDLKVIASHDSAPLSELLKKVLKDSNNIYADSLAKTLGLKKFQKGTFQSGTRAIKKILAKPTGIDFNAVRLFDGSGLSYYNLTTPFQISNLLLTMYHDNKNSESFQKMLPVSGENGTISNRLNSLDLQGRIRAKTGSLLNVSALAGYLRSQLEKELVFVIMVDHVIERKEKINHFQTELCRLFTLF